MDERVCRAVHAPVPPVTQEQSTSSCLSFLPLAEHPAQWIMSHTAMDLTCFLPHVCVLPVIPAFSRRLSTTPASWLPPRGLMSPTWGGSCRVKGCLGCAPCCPNRTHAHGHICALTRAHTLCKLSCQDTALALAQQ